MKSMIMKFGLGIATVLLTLSACHKVEDTVAVIKVVNAAGTAIPGASVRLYATGSTDEFFLNDLRFDTTGITNGSGKVTIDFSEYYESGQAGFAVLDIATTKGVLSGEGIIKIEEQSTTEETVTVQ